MGQEITRFTDLKTVSSEDLLRFLEEDPPIDGSGYVKEEIWDRIHHYSWSDQDRERIEKVALSYINKRMTREFRHMCRGMARVAREAFWGLVSEHLAHASEDVRKRALLLLAYSKGIEFGQKSREAFNTEQTLNQFLDRFPEWREKLEQYRKKQKESGAE